MKLELRQKGDVQILRVLSPDSIHDLKVLKAGIIHLFKKGKNKIILELTQAKSLQPDALRELAILNLTARELAGEILLSGVDPETRQKIEHFSKPPAVLCFANTEAAIAQFRGLQTESSEPDPLETPVVPPIDREELQKRELGDVGALRKEIERLKVENRKVIEQLTFWVVQSREVPDSAAYKARIAALESELEELLSKTVSKAAAK